MAAPISRWSPFDGRSIPYPDQAFVAVTFVDVLHHTDDPAVLLREGVRVARKCVVIKDHACDGFLSKRILRFMDWVSNRRHGVVLPYNYWRIVQWQRAFDALAVRVGAWRTDLKLYPWPATLLFDRRLHFIARLESSGTAGFRTI